MFHQAIMDGQAQNKNFQIKNLNNNQDLSMKTRTIIAQSISNHQQNPYQYEIPDLLLLYSSIKPEGMETAHLATYLDHIAKAFNRNPNKSHLIGRIASTDPANTSTMSEFSQQVLKKIVLVKQIITDAVSRASLVPDGQSLSSTEMNILRIVSSKMNVMNREYMFLLEEGILNLFMDADSLVKTSKKSKVRTTIRNLLKQICQSLKILLIEYFVYQEYLIRKQNTDRKRQNITHSILEQDKGKNMEQSLIQDVQLVRQIQTEINGTPMHQLLKKQVKNQEKKIKEAVQTCRICFKKILLQNIEAHVKVCQKQNTLSQNIEEKSYELAHLRSQLKRKSQQIAAKASYSEFQEDFILISRIISSAERKQKHTSRRCSLIGVRSEKHIGDNIQNLIEQFMETHGEEPLLQKVLNTYREKIYLEKKLNQTQIHSLHHNSQNSPRRSKDKAFMTMSPTPSNIKINRFQQKQKPQQKSKNSIDEAKQHKQSSNNSIQSESEHQQQKQQQVSLKIMKSKRALSRKAVKDDNFEEIYTFKPYSSLQLILQSKDKDEISLNNFQILKILGQGAFGKVYMVRRKQTRDIYALKIIKIPENNIETSLELIKRQHEIFKKIAGEHLVKAPFSFSEKSCHIFILEYLPGGDLRKLLNQQVYLEQGRAKAYLAEIILAIEHLHNFNIIHRDLKPENLVFDRMGHLKLTDFGLSEFQMEEKMKKSQKQQFQRDCPRRTRKRRQAVLSNNKQKMKLIGTPDYIAPEIIFKTSLSNFSIDWWSLGVMAYELMIGTRPFCASTIEEVIDNITNFNIEWPEVGYEEGMISPQAKDLICQLLDKDFMHRLGAKGAEEIKSHPFFQGICWETIKSDKPLVIPKITNVRQCIEIQQDISLRKEISQFLQKGQKKRTVDLEKFIRFDLLGSETIENVNKVHEQQYKKLKTLKELQQTFLTEDCETIEDQ